MNIVTGHDFMSRYAEALAVFDNVFTDMNIPQGDLVAVGNITVNLQGVAVALLVENLDLAAADSLVGEDSGNIVKIIDLQGKGKFFIHDFLLLVYGLPVLSVLKGGAVSYCTASFTVLHYIR